MTGDETSPLLAVIWARFAHSLLVRHSLTLQSSVLQKEAKILTAE